MKTYYETVIIYTPRTTIDSSIPRIVADMLQTVTGTEYKINIDLIGTKKLAYELKGYPIGYYVIYRWLGTEKDVQTLESFLRERDEVLKFMTVRRDETDDDVVELEKLSANDKNKSEQKISGEVVDAMAIMLRRTHHKK